MSKYDFNALRRLNRADVRMPELSGPGQDVEIWETAAGGRKRIGEGTGKGGLLWLGENATLRIGDVVLVAPMTYCCTGSTDPGEASCICARLPVSDLPDSAGLGYWPSYSRMSPAQRGRYLRWLAGGRRAHLDDIGYAFVYFYGLERRALVDGQDALRIVDEVRRLLVRYPASRSFRKYLGGFLACLYARNLGNPFVTEERLLDLHAFAPVPRKTSFLLLLGWYALRGTALSPEQAFYVLRNLPGPKNADVSFPLRYRDAFFAAYRQAYPSGFSLSVSSRKCVVEYGTASATLSFGSRGSSPPPAGIPNVLGKMSQFKKLRALLDSCTEGGDAEDELVLVRRGEKRPGEPLPGRRKTAPPAEPAASAEIVIDRDRLARLRKETESVARQLAGILDREEPPAPVPRDEKNQGRGQENNPLPFPGEAVNRLHPKYRAVLRALPERG
ncbi:MAG: TerB N-terminal domain-containing protein, partial [Synergistaceae bacterium]|nr:TerB N-terminal domain-containing protein [Synergistaceae bacterium]